MSWLPLAFGTPVILWGLVVLPVIWWLLRLTPPRPQSETFPPLAILARIVKREETPHQSPWWLTLLRLLLAALVILALAAPVLNPRQALSIKGSALALVIDNGWASAPDWERRVATASKLIADARENGEPVLLALTAAKPNAEIGPFDAEAALQHLNAAAPMPVPTDRPAVFRRVAAALADLPGANIAILTDGLAAPGDETAFDTLLGARPAHIDWFGPGHLSQTVLTDGSNLADKFLVKAARPQGETAPRRMTVYAADDKGRRIADTMLTFGPGETEAAGEMHVPFEMRNDFATLGIVGEHQAGAVRVLDENARRRRVGLLSQGEADQGQPLLSPLYYISRALSPYADLIEPSDTELTKAIPELIDRNPAVIVMADVGKLPDSTHAALASWVRDGGTLIRFAGPRLAASGADDDELLPVRLRGGERALGGTLSWTEPQPVADFPENGPFADLAPPRDVTVSRQVLAEPSPDIVEHSWASLADGTPLLTGARRGEGTVVLFHVTPEATWSNLPISGSFVEMLRRVVQLSHNQGRPDAQGQEKAARLPPYRMIAATGELVAPPPDAEPLVAGANAPVTLANPPGLYGNEDGVVAHNLFGPKATLRPVERPKTDVPLTEAHYAADQSRDLRGPLFAAALVLMLLDTIAVLWLGGVMRRRRPAPAANAAFVLAAGMAIAAFLPHPALAQDAKQGDDKIVAAVTVTRIGYVVTGNPSVDTVSRAGIEGLSQFLADKTALEPGEPAGVDISSDELSFYPLLYWPVDADAPVPSEEAMARVDAYMRQGGTVLFDTRDQYESGFSTSGTASAATMRLREILAGLDIPPLEPVPEDHVLTKSFFIMNEFPGRYRGSPLWVEASADAESRSGRPVRTGDGVSPIMITANDFAGAWAVDAQGNPLLPTVPGDPAQRVYAYRAGVNIMMYMLTGNYKSDQVHVPVLLERLGQ